MTRHGVVAGRRGLRSPQKDFHSWCPSSPYRGRPRIPTDSVRGKGRSSGAALRATSPWHDAALSNEWEEVDDSSGEVANFMVYYEEDDSECAHYLTVLTYSPSVDAPVDMWYAVEEDQ